MAIETWQNTGQYNGFNPSSGSPGGPPGGDWVITGYKPVKVNAPKFNSGYYTEQRPIYSRVVTPPAAEAPAAPKLTIKDLYQTVLGRDPDEEGASYWQSVFGPDIDAAEAAAFGLAASKELNPPAAPAQTSNLSPIRTPRFEEPANTGPDFASMFAQMQAQSQAQMEQIMGPLLQTIGDIQRQILDEQGARQEDMRRMAEASRVAQINQARSQAAGNLQIQGAPSDSSTGGTSAFKIRKPNLNMLDQNIFDQFTNTLNI
jgi:hypothetical protein